MKQTILVLIGLLFISNTKAQDKLEFFLGTKGIIRTAYHIEPLEFADGTLVEVNAFDYVFRTNWHLAATAGIIIPIKGLFSIKLGTSIQQLPQSLMIQFPIEGPFETISKGRPLHYSVLHYEAALRFKKKNRGMELGVGIFHRYKKLWDPSYVTFRELNKEQNDFINYYDDFIKPYNLMFRWGAFYRYRQFEGILNIDLGRNVHRPVTYLNETETPNTAILQTSVGINYHIPFKRK